MEWWNVKVKVILQKKNLPLFWSPYFLKRLSISGFQFKRGNVWYEINIIAFIELALELASFKNPKQTFLKWNQLLKNSLVIELKNKFLLLLKKEEYQFRLFFFLVFQWFYSLFPPKQDHLDDIWSYLASKKQTGQEVRYLHVLSLFLKI